jgi:hypothetical protein
MAHPPIPTGIYRHFKGGSYEVIGTAQLVDTSEWFVIYRPLYGNRELVARRLTEFASTVRQDGREVPRFLLETPASSERQESPSVSR